jgi:RND family efflux transporter MFP subunit
LITSVLADIQFDYPSSLATWKNYLSSININKTLPNLPEIESEKERNFITSKNINSTFYSIKNLETRLQKHAIKAPFSGVLVDANVTPGTLISPGQKLGEFIRPAIYELELNVNANLQGFLKIGKTVELQDIEKTKTWKGKVTRINQKIDRNSQTIKIFVEVTAKDLKEGEYLEASVFAKEETSAIEIPRALLVKNHSIYIVKDSVLQLQKVEIVYSNLNSVVIKGLENGLEYISKPVVGSYEGMRVKISK